MQKKYLLVCLDNLGDLVMVSSLAETISRENLASSVGVLCKPYCASIARMFPGVKKIHLADPPWDRTSPGSSDRGSWNHFLKILRQVHHEKYDVVLMATRQWRLAMSFFLKTSIPDRRGLSDWKASPWLNHAVSWNPKALNQPLFSATLNHLLRPDGIEEKKAYARLELPPEIHDTVRGLREKSLFRDPFKKKVLLNPFAGSIKRCWPLKNWIALAEKLRVRDVDVFWSGTPQDRSKLKEFLPYEETEPNFSSVSGWNQLNDFEQSIALMMSVDLFIGHDSGPLHVASALGKACIGIYLPSLYPRTAPQGRAQAVIIHRESPESLSLTDVYQTCMQTMEALPSGPNG